MAEAAAAIGAVGACLILLAGGRAALLAGLALTVVAMAGLASADGQLDALGDLFGSVTGVGALLAGVAALAAVAAVLVRWPLAIVPALLVVAPIRLPIASDPESPVLLGVAGSGAQGRLYPLFAVLAASVAALIWRGARGVLSPPLPGRLALPAAAFIAVTSLSLLWSDDQPAAVADLLFEWLPFTILLVVCARAPFGVRSPRYLAVTLVAVASAFAAVAVWQAATERLIFYTVSLERANELSDLFRVTAAFQDPNHLGRHLVLAIAVVLVAAWAARLGAGASTTLLVLLGAGLLFTYSQSSLVTLVVVALVIGLAAATGPPRRALAAATTAITVGGVVALAVLVGGGSADSVTSDRSTLVADTVAVAAGHPVIGVGVAAQPFVTRVEQAPDASELQNVSHTTPLTVAAELGIVGLALFAALAAGTALVLTRVARRDRALAIGLGAVLLALFVHSLFYAGLFENPITWGALGVVSAAAGPWRGPAGSVPALRSWSGPR
jgi:hypothetical protein